MIIPNLMVTDMERSIAFYRDVLGLKVAFTIDGSRDMTSEGVGKGAVFATLEWEGSQLMLQTVGSLAEEVPGIDADQAPGVGGTVYLRGMDPRSVRERVPKEAVQKGPERAWYGMLELYLRDPDGHVVCLGIPEGPAPG